MATDRAAHRIEKAVSDGRLVRVTRRKGWDYLDGSIIDGGPKWLLMAIEVDAGFDGHALIRTSDVRRVERSRNADFLERALAAEKHWPLPGLDGTDLSTTRALLESLVQITPLVSVHYEQDHPDECLIGTPHHFRARQFRLRNVTPAAEWDRPMTQSSATAQSVAWTSATPTSDVSRTAQARPQDSVESPLVAGRLPVTRKRNGYWDGGTY